MGARLGVAILAGTHSRGERQRLHEVHALDGAGNPVELLASAVVILVRWRTRRYHGQLEPIRASSVP
ncbi:MAG: hypothetical protein OXH23_07280 [bacterium]|nr:hypothetical protein [bacterium]